MPRLSERLDVSSVSVTFLPLPKGKKRGWAAGFCGGDPVASLESGSTAPPFCWIRGKTQPIQYQDIRKINANGASGFQLAGFWRSPKGDERALVWTRDANGFSGVELHPAEWQKSVAIGCGDGHQIGFGYKKFVSDPSRALVWSGSRESLVVLAGPDPSRGTMGHAVDHDVQGGYVGGPGHQHACLWRGSSDRFVDLHPEQPNATGSEVHGIGDGQQVGLIWNERTHCEAALWTGTASSYVNLSPDGFTRSRATRCARGLQIGWIAQDGRNMMLRAVVWNGLANEYLDLQRVLPDPWNASYATDLLVSSDRVRILGTAQRVIDDGKSEMDGGKVPVMWEMKLLIVEAEAGAAASSRAPSAPSITTTKVSTALSDDQRIDALATAFGQAIVDKNFTGAHRLLAPWLRRAMPTTKLREFVTTELIEGVQPVDFATGGNSSELDALRSEYAIAKQVTPGNFKQWMSIEFTPDPDGGSDLDFCLRLWIVVVELQGEMKIGYVAAE